MLPSVSNVFLIYLYVSLCFCYSEAVTNMSVPAVFAFGNSFVDSGNNNMLKTIGKANFPPYGKDFIGGIPTGRFTNNRTLADFVALKLGVKDYLPAYLDPSLQNNDIVTGVSFGSGGSGLDPATSELTNVLSLPDQLELFKEYIGKLQVIVGEDAASNIINSSIYVVTSSTNDWILSYTLFGFRRVQYNVTTYANLLIQNDTQFIQELYNLGARKIVFFNTPIIGCLPLSRTIQGGVLRNCGVPLNTEAQTFNSMLNRQIQLLGSNLTQSRFTIVDYFSILQDIIQHPVQYGFQVIDKGCCGTGLFEFSILCNPLSLVCPDDTKYLFWDSVHPTDKGYNIIVDHALGNISSILK